ncbi:MAG: tetratricopeptide repeat protein [Gammaproteobacteria bacterium]|nr:tetratricopeptide repeat protein [Gammaproteobacteria bacterium]
MKKLRIFISSPGDVFEERAIAQRVVQRLQSEYIGRVVLEPVLWEHEPLVATANFQDQIIRPSDTDVVISILWSRLGTRLPKGFTRPDGSRYDSGTEYEFEDAIEGFRKNGKPDLLVYRKMAPPSVRLDDEIELLDRLAQKKKLDEFVDKWFHDKSEGTLVAAFHAFESPSDFEELLEGHLHKLVERALPESIAATSDAPAVWKSGSPFRGLHSFHFEHAPIFFGRTKAVSDVLQALRDQAADNRAFVLILGMSGGGKSSVARAGVLPMLTRPGVIEGIGLWRRAVFRPTDVRNDLFAGLATALLREPGLPSLDAENNGPAELAQILRESPQAAVSLLKNALAQEAAATGKNVQARLALVIDQMEEMYTQEGVLPRDRKAFVDTLDALARCGRVWIIGTLRSDFYPRLANLPTLVELKEGTGQYDLMAPTSSEIAQMIRLPTRAAGLRFEEDPASSERLDDMLRDAATEHPEVLPLLQFTLEELYQRRTDDGMLTLKAYRDLGGVEGSLAQRAETVFKDLPDDVEAELPKVLNALVSIEQDGHESIGRRRAPWSDAIKGGSRKLIETFVENRLFVTELADDGNAVVTVAHEALLWHWPRVREWVEQNRENLRIRGRIAAAAERWEIENERADLLLPAGKPLGEAESLLEQDIELEEDEANFIRASIAKAKRVQRLKAGVVATLAVLVVVAAASAFLANQQRNLADEARARAEIDAETAKQTTGFMVGLFEVSDPSEALGNTITAREIMDQGAARIEQELSAQPATQATLMETMGTVYTSLGLYDQASSLLQSALDKRRDLYGDQHLEVARSLDRLGEVLTLKAEYAEALDMYSNALTIRRALLGDEHVDVARSLYELADLRVRMGEYDAAEPMFRQALALQRELIGEKSPEVAKSLEGLALNLYEQSSYDDAVLLMHEAVALRRDLHDGPHPDLAEALNNLSFVLGETGKYQESTALVRESLEMKRQLFGDAHPEIAMGLNNLAFALHDQGEYDAAEYMYRDAIEMQRTLLGDYHPDVAMALNNLAFLLYDKGNLDSALKMSRESLDMYQQTLGNEHPSVARGMNNLAMWLLEGGDTESAEPLLRDALELRKKLLGPEHTEVAGSMTLLADLLIESERYQEARQLAADAKVILVQALAEDHWRTAGAMSAEGGALTGLEQFAEAEQLLLKSYEVLKNDSGALPVVVSNTARRLATLYQAWGKADEAAKYRAML